MKVCAWRLSQSTLFMCCRIPAVDKPSHNPPITLPCTKCRLSTYIFVHFSLEKGIYLWEGWEGLYTAGKNLKPPLCLVVAPDTPPKGQGGGSSNPPMPPISEIPCTYTFVHFKPTFSTWEGYGRVLEHSRSLLPWGFKHSQYSRRCIL